MAIRGIYTEEEIRLAQSLLRSIGILFAARREIKDEEIAALQYGYLCGLLHAGVAAGTIVRVLALSNRLAQEKFRRSVAPMEAEIRKMLEEKE